MRKVRAYVKPIGVFIVKENAAQLYLLEEERDRAIQAAATELGKKLGHQPEQYWTHTMPEALLNTLASFDTFAAVLAAEAYLERHKEDC